jgi:hypothetical protein
MGGMGGNYRTRALIPENKGNQPVTEEFSGRMRAILCQPDSRNKMERFVGLSKRRGESLPGLKQISSEPIQLRLAS